MSRSSWKFPYTHKTILLIDENNDQRYVDDVTKKNKKLFLFQRSGMILDSCLDKTCLVWNGNRFISVFVDKDKYGFKFGEFAPTRKKPIHKTKKKAKS